MKNFNFCHLINNKSVAYTLLSPTQGAYDDQGEYKAGEIKRWFGMGVIVPFSSNKIYQSGGSITTMDRELYSSTPVAFTSESRVEFNEHKYTIEISADYSAYSDVYIYKLKWVDIFDRLKK